MAEENQQPSQSIDQLFREKEIARKRAYLKIAEQHDRRVLESVNAAPAPQLTAPWKPPLLPEQTLTGYRDGVQSWFQAVSINGYWVEKFTAYDYLQMHRAAKRAGVVLRINSAYRSFEEQARIYNDRYTNGVLNANGKKKGKAAKPGYSNHQEGVSLDIEVGAVYTSPAYLWLAANAKYYGFVNDVADEPWHWTHPERKIIAVPEDEDTYVTLVDAGVLAADAVRSNASRLSTLLGRELYDAAQGFSRSLEMSQTQRSGIFAALGERAVWDGASTSNFLADMTQAETAASRERAAFNKPSLSPLEYNFETGEWGDKQVV